MDIPVTSKTEAAAASAWRTVTVAPASPLDLSGANAFGYDIDSYGGVPGATYETRLTLRNGDDSFSLTSAMSPD